MYLQQNIEDVTDALVSALGEQKVLNDDFILSSYTKDVCSHFFPLSTPSLITLPHSTEDVQKIVQIANQYKIPIVPSGGRSSHWGAIDSCQGIAIDMCKMREVIEIDEKNLTFTVQPGAGVHTLNRDVLKKRGFCYPTHPLNLAPICFGSEVAKNTGGECGAMYGHVSKRIVGLEVVLGNGEIIETGSSRVIKNTPNFQQSGLPDMTQLFVGSEGAFGVITQVTMSMQLDALAYEGADIKFEGTMEGLKNLVNACHEMRSRRVVCNAHWLDTYAVWLIAKMMAPEGVEVGGESEAEKFGHMALLEIESSISQEECDLKKRAAIEICNKHGGEYVGDRMTQTASYKTLGKEFLKNLSGKAKSDRGAYTQFGDIPYHSMPGLYEKWIGILNRYNWPKDKANYVAAFGDESCLGFYCLFADVHDKEDLQTAIEIDKEAMKMYSEVGMIPYRTGRIWRPYILDKLDWRYLKYIRSLKRQFDPNNIMNPGVSVFEEEYK